jgi:hypothetical protein
MATFGLGPIFKFHFINHTKGQISYDLGSVGQPGNVGSFGPGQSGESKPFTIDRFGGTALQQGNVVVVKIRGDNNPGIRFWSGSGGQYINLLGGNGYVVTRDSSEISELAGNGFRVTVDGAGNKDPSVESIYIQAYNA